MKYRLVIILLMFMFVGSSANAQTFRDSNNMQLGKVESDGTVRKLALSRRMGQLEITITYDLVQLVLMV